MIRFQKDGFGAYEVIQTETNLKLKGNIKTAAKAAAYVTYYTAEVKKVEDFMNS